LAYDHYIPLCFIFFFLIKFGVGPWFVFKVHLYQYLQPSILFLYVCIYFIYLLPYSVWIVYSVFYLSYITTSIIGFWLVVSLALVAWFSPTVSTISSVLSLSSVLFYVFILTQVMYIL
jgi:hypothetical protein